MTVGQSSRATFALLSAGVIYQGVQGIAELISQHGLINVDFADVKAIMGEGGAALMAIGRASGEDRAQKAAEEAMNNTLTTKRRFSTENRMIRSNIQRPATDLSV